MRRHDSCNARASSNRSHPPTAPCRRRSPSRRATIPPLSSRRDRPQLIDPEFWVGYMMCGQAYEQLGESALAFDSPRDRRATFGWQQQTYLATGAISYAKLGQAGGRAREVLGMLEEVSRSRYMPPYAMALVHAGLGEPEAVFEWLDRAYAVRDVHLVFLTVDPKWDPYRADPRFGTLLQRCGFTPATGI